MNAPVAAGYVLGVEGSTPAAGVAIADLQGRLVAQAWSDVPAPASTRILGWIDRLMRESSIAQIQIKAVAVSHGPGAFTGLRVAMSQAKTLAHAWQVPLYCFSTLAGMARRWPGEGQAVCAALDARRGEVYSGIYRMTGSMPELQLDEAVEPAEATAAALAGLEAGDVIMMGSGTRKYRETFERALGARAIWAPAHLADPAADSVAIAGAAALASGEPGIDPLSAAPAYLRVSDAERRHPLASVETSRA